MRRSTGWLRLGLPHGAGLLLILLSAAACGSKRPATQQVLVPPRLDLRQHGRVGLILFTLERAKGDLDAFATRRFSENILAAQPGVEVP
jgi:hypothetical protein